MKLRDVSAVTAAFLRGAREALTELDTVRLDGLGAIRIVIREGRVDTLKLETPMPSPREKKYHVSFKKAEVFSRELWKKRRLERGMTMDKYAVDEQQDNEKIASEGCPECGAKVERHGNVLACPVHGTEPFEKKKDK